MRKIDQVTGKRQLLARATQIPPFGPGFDLMLAEEADTMEVWATR